jgi:hypothetical protein
MPVHSVEGLCDQLRSAAKTGGDVSLWVPDALTLKGKPVPQQPTGIAMSIITDTALSLGLWPNGFTEGTDGRIYHYQAT